MKTALVAAALCITSVGWAAPGDGHISGPRWSVDYYTHFDGLDANGFVGETAVSRQGESVLWASDARTYSTYWSDSSQLRPRGAFAFVPEEGYAISGFDIVYDISFATTPTVADGNQYSLQGERLAPGTVIAGTGSFATSTGGAATFDYLHTVAVVTDHLIGSAPFSFQSSLNASHASYLDCTFLVPGISCSTFGLRQVYGSLTLNSVTITPTVFAVPEPETYALMLGGLALLWARSSRKNRSQPATQYVLAAAR